MAMDREGSFVKLRGFLFFLTGAVLVWSQAAPPTAAPAPAAKKAPAPAARPAAAAAVKSPIDSVIELVKAGMSENMIIRSLKSQNKAMSLAPSDMVRLKNAGVSETVIEVMMDPSTTPQAAAAPAPTPAPAPVAAAPAPAPEPSSSAPASALPAAVTQAQKQRVIVDEFDYSAVSTAVQNVFGTTQNIGKGIRAMLTKRVAEQGKVVIVERAKINNLQSEQDRNASNRVKQGTGARIGRITGANLQFSGDIIIFGRDDKQTKVKGGGIVGGVFGAVGAAKKEDKAVVAINYRLIDVETSEIIATGEARGESSRKSKGFGAIAGAFGKGLAGVEVDMTSSGFAETIIGEATMDCVNKLADFISAQTTNMKQTAREVETVVADVNGSTLTIAAGSGDGVNTGEVFEIHKVLREVKDPVTKEVLDKVTEKVGEMTVNTVRDRVSMGTYRGGAAQVGFVARKKI
jgi:curli biogenesis system outer membrane secretion channel CsgG